MMNTQRVQASWKKTKCPVFSVVIWWLSEILGQTPLDFPLPAPFLVKKDRLMLGTSHLPPDLGAVPEGAESSADGCLLFPVDFVSCLENSRFFTLNVKHGYHLRMCSKDFKDASLSTVES